jgi:hypothetical protein
MREIGNADKILVGKPQGKKLDGRWREMLEDNIKMDLKETGWQLYRHLWAKCLENVEASTSQNTMGLHGLLQG